MGKFIALLVSKVFWKNILLGFGFIVTILLIVFLSLKYYTRHGQSITVPDLRGVNVMQATELLNSMGFKYKIDSTYALDKVPGTVFEQDPDANSIVKEGRTIYLTIVTRTIPTVVLPDLFDMTFVEANSVLEIYGFKVGQLIYKPDVAQKVLGVSQNGQTLRPGAVLTAGSVIDLIIGDGSGSEFVNLPYLIGLNLDEASFVIRGASLLLGSVFYDSNVTDSTNAIVYRQFPEVLISDSSTVVPRGSVVNLFLRQK